MNNLQAIFFDFDGVIADSVHIKTEAFEKLYKPYGNNIVNLVRKHHLEHGGISRYEKIRYYHENYLKKRINEAEINNLADIYSTFVCNAVIDSQFIPGVIDLLNKIYQKIELFVISATPHDEINKIVEKKGIKKYFKLVCGSPKKKATWIDYILKSYNISNKSSIFIGDMMADYLAAEHSSVRFIARVDDKEKNIFLDKNVDEFIIDFHELDKKLF
jgi:phosphoglycolate phosphatase-like HAD superfamily hydrolase